MNEKELLEKLNVLKRKFPGATFVLLGIDTTCSDFLYYFKLTNNLSQKANLKENILSFTGHELKKSPSVDDETTIKDDEIFYYLNPIVSENLRRDIENTCFRIASFKDKTLRLINNLAGFHLKERDVKLEIMRDSLRMYDYATFKKILIILNNENFQKVGELRNNYIHADSLWFDIEEENNVFKINIKHNSSNIFNQKPKYELIDLVELFLIVAKNIIEVLGLLSDGIDDMRSKKKKLFN